jgi:hypothetical protein
MAGQALDLVRGQKERGHEAWILRLHAEIASRLGVDDSAEQRFDEAMNLAVSLGMRPLVAHCHLGLGTLYRRTDKREQAHGHLATAMTMYREMGMTYWLEKAEAEMTKPGG